MEVQRRGAALTRYAPRIDDSDDEQDEQNDWLDAGPFGTWLDEILPAIRGERGSTVPCGTCTACCASSQFIHIGPDERDALASIPSALLFPAPRMPRGHQLMGYDEHGRCPMLVDNACTIYATRPQTCRTYDCRVFPAAGLEPDEADKATIAAQVRRWRFEHPHDTDRAQHAAVRAAAAYLADHPDTLAPADRAHTATQLAVLAVEVHEAFRGAADGVPPDPEVVRVELIRRRGAVGR